MRRAAPAAVVFLATFLALGFLALPVVAIFAHVSPGKLAAQLGNGVVTDALVVSLKTTLAAQALVLALGTPAAWVLASRRFHGRSLLVTLVELPLVLPPAVAIPFTQTAVVLAVSFVASPLYVRAAIAAFEGIDANIVDASRTLGAGPVRTFFRVVLPLSRAGLVAGAALAFARGLGEFGATIMFAGSLRGVTQTLPLAVYAEFDVNFDVALAVSALLILISAALLITLKWLPSASTSRFRFATSS